MAEIVEFCVVLKCQSTQKYFEIIKSLVAVISLIIEGKILIVKNYFKRILFKVC